MRKALGFAVMFAAVACDSGKSATSPTASPRFAPVGDVEMVRCSADACDQFAFFLRNVGDVCVVTLDFRGTITLMKASGVTSTANWTIETCAPLSRSLAATLRGSWV
jgi:hypothetical protein